MDERDHDRERDDDDDALDGALFIDGSEPRRASSEEDGAKANEARDVLIGIVTEVNRNNQKLAVSGLSQHFQKIFRMVGLAQYADIYQEEDEAVQSMTAAAR